MPIITALVRGATGKKVVASPWVERGGTKMGEATTKVAAAIVSTSESERGCGSPSSLTKQSG